VDLRETYEVLARADIERFIKEGKEEDLHLDFKTVNAADLKSGSDRKNFAKALSGFANSDGGIVVWGVVARRDSSYPPWALDRSAGSVHMEGW